MRYEVQFKDYNNGLWHTVYEGAYDEMLYKLYEHREQNPNVVSRLVQVHVVLDAKDTGARGQYTGTMAQYPIHRVRADYTQS